MKCCRHAPATLYAHWVDLGGHYTLSHIILGTCSGSCFAALDPRVVALGSGANIGASPFSGRRWSGNFSVAGGGCGFPIAPYTFYTLTLYCTENPNYPHRRRWALVGPGPVTVSTMYAPDPASADDPLLVIFPRVTVVLNPSVPDDGVVHVCDFRLHVTESP